MAPPVDVEDVTLRVQRYWMEDGLVEITIGLMFVLMAGGTLTMGLSIFGAIGLFWGFKKLKERITFPRCGYVVLPQQTGKHQTALWMFAMFAVAGVTFSLLTNAPRMAVPASAVILALALIGPGLQVKVPRMVWEGILILLAGAFLYWFTDWKGSRGLMAFMAIVGALIAIIGSLQLRSFLKANPKRQGTPA
jgi:hypothetical protein